MLRQYKNPKIYRNFRIASVLSTIALFLALLWIIVDIVNKAFKTPPDTIEPGITLYILILLLPVSTLGFSLRSLQPPKKFIRETRFNNDLTNLLAVIIVNYTPWIFCLFCIIIGFWGVVGYLVRQIFLPHLFLDIASVFLIHSYILIKREWKENLPAFKITDKLKKEAKNLKKEAAQRKKIDDENNILYEKLINQCGVKFFIKYYSQVRRLPLRDINIEEEYPFEEKMERLNATKKIIDLQLSEFAIKKILSNYSDILTEKEISDAKAIIKHN